MIDIQTAGNKTGTIDVELSYRIIELFSGGLYSSPNKTFEELVTNSYDADAQKVAVGIPNDLVNNDFLWVLDDGTGMDSAGLRQLWRIGYSTKRDSSNPNKRIQIGKFGIGKLATFILANQLTYVCKKDGLYKAVTMDFSRIQHTKGTQKFRLEERTIKQAEVELIVNQYVKQNGVTGSPFPLFGKSASVTWTFCLMTVLKTRATEIQIGRLKWILQTALPLNPGFNLTVNGQELKSSKVGAQIEKTWKFGIDDKIVDQNDDIEISGKGKNTRVLLPNIINIHGEVTLYKDSLATGKSENLGRSHGIFLTVRGRLINVNDHLLPGMSQFAHGMFNRTQMNVYADELDEHITSTRESIKDTPAYNDLKQYLTKKYNEVHSYWLKIQTAEDKKKDVPYKVSVASYTLTRGPIFSCAKKIVSGEISESFLIDMPDLEADEAQEFINSIEEDLDSEEGIIREFDEEYNNPSLPLCRLDLRLRKIFINMLHPIIMYYKDSMHDLAAIRVLATTEVLLEAQQIEVGLDDGMRMDLAKRRDQTLRAIASTDKQSPASIAQMIADAENIADGLEDAVVAAFNCLGFDAVRIGKKSNPDGIAVAHLGQGTGVDSTYKVTLEAKSTKHTAARTTNINISNINSHRKQHGADFAIVIAPNFEGADDPNSVISNDVDHFRATTTLITTVDLAKLLFLSGPKQISLAKLREMFESCARAPESRRWIAELENREATKPPYHLLIDTIYELQKEDQERPTISAIRMYKPKPFKQYSIATIREWVEILSRQLPHYISLDNEVVSLTMNPKNIKRQMANLIQDAPTEWKQLHQEAFGVSD